MLSNSGSQMLMILGLVWLLIGIGILVWYLWAMARLFPRIGLKSSDGWIPIWNQWKLLERVGLPGWVVLLSFVGLSIVPAIMLIIAMHRINKEFGAGGGYTVLGVFIAPLWAMLIANFIDDRKATSGPTRQPQVAPVFNSAANRGFAPGTQPATPPAFASLGAPPSAPQAAAPAPAPTMFQAQSSGFLPPQQQYQQPPIPQQQGFAPQAPQPWNPAPPVAQNPQPPQAPSAPPGLLGGETEAEYDRLAAESFYASPAVPLGQNQAPSPFSWTAASQAARAQAEPEREPVIPPVHPLAAATAVAPLPPAPPAPPAPATPVEPAEVAQSIPATMPVSLPSVAAVAVAPLTPQVSTVAAPVVTPPAEESHFTPPVSMHAAPTPAVQIPTGITGKVDPLPSVEGYAAATRASSRREPAYDEDDLDRTVVVPRAQVPAWVLELPDGTELPIQGDVTVGRRPEPIEGSEVLAIPDTTRTLSKSHARLSFIEGRWIVEDLGSTNGLVLMNDDGSESELVPGVRAEATERMLFGTLEVRLRPRGESA